MKFRTAAFAIALLLSSSARAETSLAPFEASSLAPGVHLLKVPEAYRGNYIGNVTVIEQRDGFVVIDSGGAVGDGRRIVAFVRAQSSKPVKAVAITHWHHDHPLGVSAIRDAWPHVRIIATPQTRDAMLGTALKYVALKPSEKVDAATVNQLSGSLSRAHAGLADPATPADVRVRYQRVLRDVAARMGDVGGTYLVPPTEIFTSELLIDAYSAGPPAGSDQGEGRLFGTTRPVWRHPSQPAIVRGVLVAADDGQRLCGSAQPADGARRRNVV